jgi:predicted RNA-binding protein with PUA-like domain
MVFQGNPKYYDVERALKELDEITWGVNQYKNQIKKGDKVYFWLSGSEGGIIATGIILCDPEMRKTDNDDRYSHGESSENEERLVVDIKIERKLDKIVSRSTMLSDERTKRMEVLTFPGATNFRVTKAQEEVIENILAGSYQQVAAIDVPEDDVVDKKRYWLIAPGENARLWDSFSQETSWVSAGMNSGFAQICFKRRHQDGDEANLGR